LWERQEIQEVLHGLNRKKGLPSGAESLYTTALDAHKDGPMTASVPTGERIACQRHTTGLPQLDDVCGGLKTGCFYVVQTVHDQSARKFLRNVVATHDTKARYLDETLPVSCTPEDLRAFRKRHPDVKILAISKMHWDFDDPTDWNADEVRHALEDLGLCLILHLEEFAGCLGSDSWMCTMLECYREAEAVWKLSPTKLTIAHGSGHGRFLSLEHLYAQT
jgi:hypothetical protein